MKARSFITLLFGLVVTSVIVCMLGGPQPAINEIVSETHRHITQLKQLKQQVVTYVEPLPSDRYLQQLGFKPKPRLYPTNIYSNITLPVFVSAISSPNIPLVSAFVRSLQKFYPEHSLFLYMLSLSDGETSQVEKACNQTTNCTLFAFKYEQYPSHVANLKLLAYRPIIIQEVLDNVGALFWLDIEHVFTSSQLEELISNGQTRGLLSWSIDEPTSALTHPRMFDYFHTRREYYYFQHMIEPRHLLLYNLPSVHHQVMRPWVQCALTPDCIAPIGSQSLGCRFDKKPLFRYSGCHRYDMSALNVILGLVSDLKPFIAKDDQKFFAVQENEGSKTADNNATSPSPAATVTQIS